MPHDGDDAGGEATFRVATYQGRRFLVAVTGSFWRSAGGDRYDQSRHTLLGWRFGRADEATNVGWAPLGDMGQATPE